MQKFTTLTGIAAYLPMINVDTDMIIPKQYLKTIKRTGLGKGLFAELRYDEQGDPLPDFVLHKPPYTQAKILITGENFAAQEIRGPDGGAIKFDIDPFRKRCLMEGLDDIGLTLEKAEAIEAFEQDARAARPWA
jgi:3-isopropylmalate dehydratase small subunit